jgi:hypothetical protein
MLTIRQDQFRALEGASIRSFETSMLDHAFGFAPRHCQILGRDGVFNVIRFAMRRAERYGLTWRGPIRLYLELVFLIGADFDTDPLLPWASTILNDPTIDNQMIRAERLYNAMYEYLDRVAGPDNAYARSALLALRAARSLGVLPEGPLLASTIVADIRSGYPEKFVYAGEAALYAMIGRAIEAANVRGFTSDAAHLLFSVLTFITGHGFASDPCLPWISRTLDDTQIGDLNRRIERLMRRCSNYLDHMLVNLDLA